MLENNIEKLNKEIIYSINSVDVPFTIEGKASLGENYTKKYNSKEYLCINVLQENENEDWNVYFKKENNNKIYELLLVGERNVVIKGIVPKNSDGLEVNIIGEFIKFMK